MTRHQVSLEKGKKTAWEAWKSYPDVTTAFATIALDPFLDFNRQSQIFGLLQRFTVVLYSKCSTLEHVDELRKELFCRDNKLMENLPPTTDSLFQHACKTCSISSQHLDN